MAGVIAKVIELPNVAPSLVLLVNMISPFGEGLDEELKSVVTTYTLMPDTAIDGT